MDGIDLRRIRLADSAWAKNNGVGSPEQLPDGIRGALALRRPWRQGSSSLLRRIVRSQQAG
jgi:hypothetical protein